MHRLFAPVLAPLIEALDPRLILETGVGSGRLTRRLLEAPGARDAMLHAVDPAPRLDPALVEAAGPRLQLHAKRAIGVIGGLGPLDLALLDGDPNWYSVRSELTIALRAAERTGGPAPLAVVHNVHWPFGRRDGYYDPEAIPISQRHAYADSGLVPGQRDPREVGLRLAPFCAVRDFEPRSGVLSGVEDVIADSDLEWTLVEVPGFHGVAVLAEARLLSQRPALAGVLEDLSSPRFLGQQARRAESARLAAEVELAEAAWARRSEAPEKQVAVGEEGATRMPQSYEEPEPGDVVLSELVRQLESERDALVAEAAGHRAQLEAYEWRVARLAEDLAGHVERLSALAGERDEDRGAAIEARVRLESTSEDLAKESAAAADLRGRVSGLEEELAGKQQELAELAERNRLLQGRLAHSQDSMQALRAERDRLRGEAERLQASLGATRSQLDEIAEHLQQAALTRRARAARGLRAFGRAVTLKRQASPGAVELARDLAERPPALGVGEPAESGSPMPSSKADVIEVKRYG